MKLNTLERLVLLNILPREGTITTIKIVRELREALSFSEEEHAALKFEKLPGGGMQWVVEADTDKEVTIGPRAHVLVSETLERMDKEGKLAEDHVGLWDKFAETEGVKIPGQSNGVEAAVE